MKANNSEKYQIHTLANGLRVVAAQLQGEVSYVGLLVNAGSRDEATDQYGMAHFVEHTLFKGTRHRRSRDIAQRMETIGGELNAYTTKEETMIYTNAPAGHVARSLELISDLIKTSIFPERDIEREKDVIIEEINSYRDSPSDSVFDDFEELIYAGSGLSHNILGSQQSVNSLSGSDARAFVERFYTPENMVLYCVDPSDPARNLRLAERYFGDLNFPMSQHHRTPPPAINLFSEEKYENNHQANTIIGTRLFGRQDPRRHALFLLNNYLGGPCMNSRLNLEMRERNGLVYTVESNVGLLSDTGLLTIYFGSDRNSLKRCRKMIEREIDRLAQSPLSPRAFLRVRDQYCGQLIMSSEHRESRAMSLAKSILYFGEVHDTNHTAERIRNLKAEDIQEMAQLIQSNGLSSLTLS